MNRYERRKMKKEINIFSDLINIIKQYFPDLIEKFDKLTDVRHQSYVDYSMKTIMFVRLLALICGLKSMRDLSNTFNTDETISNIKKILDIETEEIPHYDTINNVFESLQIEELRKIQKYMVNRLLRSKMFDKYRYKGKYFQIVVDGTGLAMFNTKHCENCLVRKYKHEDGTTTDVYYHYVLEAKLIVGDIVISIDTEFVENEKEEIKKQDCELKAFYRMAERLKRNYPKLPIIITADALYVGEPVIEICEKNQWEYILTLKKDKASKLTKEFEGIIKLEDESQKEAYNISNEVRWNKTEINVYRYKEKIEGKLTVFTWITSFKITNKNVEELMQLGRNRWKIENEGFNIQKNETFDIVHVYSRNYNAMKAHYFMIQFAHTIRQLLEKGIKVVVELKMSIKEVSAALTQTLTTKITNLTEHKKIQLRFNTE